MGTPRCGMNTVTYGIKIDPLLEVKIATTTATISAGRIFKSFIAAGYCGEGILVCAKGYRAAESVA
jgi:hypothetical protein